MICAWRPSAFLFLQRINHGDNKDISTYSNTVVCGIKRFCSRVLHRNLSFDNFPLSWYYFSAIVVSIVSRRNPFCFLLKRKGRKNEN